MATISPDKRVVQELGGIYRFNKISQKSASMQTGISTSAISRRLNGDKSPTLEELFAMASAAGVGVRVEFVPVDTDASV